MSAGALKAIGAGCLLLCAILLFVAWERYQSNVKQVEAANQLMQSNPLGGFLVQGMTGESELKPAMPTSSKYALYFAVVSVVVGLVFLVAGFVKGASQRNVVGLSGLVKVE